MEDKYGDDAKKLALLTASYRYTKSNIVKTRGVGEDLPFNFFGWKHNDLAITVQMDYELMNLPLYERFDTKYGFSGSVRKNLRIFKKKLSKR